LRPSISGYRRRYGVKICYYGNQLGFISGSHRYVLGLAKRFMAEGHEVTVVTKGRDSRVTVLDGVRYESVSLEKRETLGSYFVEFPLRSLAYFTSHREFDIIHSMASYHLFAVLARMAGVAARTPVVYGVVSPASRALKLLRFSRLICASRGIQSHLGEGAVFVPHFVDPAGFRTEDQYDYGQEGHFTVGSMGSPAPRRGLEVLIRALPLVLERHPRTRLVLAVEHPQIRYRPKLQRRLEEIKELIEHCGVSDRVQLVGQVDVPRFFNSLDVFVYAVQTTKGMIDIPPTILECLAAGCGLVTSACGGIPEVVRDHHNGLLVGREEYDEPAAYAERIVELMENRDLLTKMRAEARHSVEPYDVNQVAPQVMGVYEDVLAWKK
jgi:glycosyltransferase involved in cell wall biosynthesis